MKALVVLALVAGMVPTAWADGALTINVAEFKSEVKIKPSVQKQLEGGGMEWGLAGNRLVVSTVNKSYVAPAIDHLTRFGTSATMPLPAGEYTISCVGIIYKGGLSVAKVLSKGAYINDAVMTFRIEDGQTTTLDVRPVIRSSSGMLLKVFMPEYITRVTLNGTMSDDVSLNARGEKSIAWDDYQGDLKFKK
jgi:hypothetical protein